MGGFFILCGKTWENTVDYLGLTWAKINEKSVQIGPLFYFMAQYFYKLVMVLLKREGCMHKSQRKQWKTFLGLLTAGKISSRTNHVQTKTMLKVAGVQHPEDLLKDVHASSLVGQPLAGCPSLFANQYLTYPITGV